MGLMGNRNATADEEMCKDDDPDATDFVMYNDESVSTTIADSRLGMTMSARPSRATVVSLLTFQIFLIILFALFVVYDKNADARNKNVDEHQLNDMYPMFQDVHVMIFIGFGFLMTFLKRYGFSSVGVTMLTAAAIIQWGILCYGFFRMENGAIPISIHSLLDADIIAAAVLISFGAVLGKTSPLQIIIMGIMETVFFCVNEYIGTQIFQAIDAGGSMYVHVFGAYFGLTVSWVLYRGVKFTEKDEQLEKSSYSSDLTAMIGTIFLWLFWPSFNGALVEGDDRHRAVINTYLSLAASCVATFALSAFFDKNNKFEMAHIQNATLAGGVCIGTAANLVVQPYGALLIGSFAGILSTAGFHYIQSFLLKLIGLHDTCGVHNLHGMPGVSAGLIGALMASLANENVYGDNLYRTFAAMTPMNNTMAFESLSERVRLEPGLGRSAATQAGFQLIALTVSFFFAVVGGVITGVTIKNVEVIPLGQHHDDKHLWNLNYLEEGLSHNALPMTDANNGQTPETTIPPSCCVHAKQDI